MSRLRVVTAATLLGTAALAAAVLSRADSGVAPGELRPPADFGSIADPSARSSALFVEASRALLSPRCVNCHPAGDHPLQGSGDRVHEPPVARTGSGMGVVGMQCDTCHGRENYDPGRVPGAPHWRLAPKQMAWEGLSPGALCAQLKDPERNGGRSLEQVLEHLREDELVAWGWRPGADREPVPGSQPELAALVEAWIATGAVCPD